MDFVSTLVFLLIVVISSSVAVKKQLANELCQPRPTVIATDHPSYRHYPYFVTLNRCSGSWLSTSPSRRKCVAATSVEIEVAALNLATLSPSDSLKVYIKMQNHTSCKSECTIKPSDCKNWETYDPHQCSCMCPHETAPKSCGPKKYWNRYTCNCECEIPASVCGKGRTWSSNTCGCTCDVNTAARCAKLNKVLDTRTCTCKTNIKGIAVEKGECHTLTSQSFWYYVVIGEFLFLVLIFDVILFSKKAGMIYSLTKSCRKSEANLRNANQEFVTSFDTCYGCRTATSSILTLNADGKTVQQLQVSHKPTEKNGNTERKKSGETINFL